MSLLRAAVPPRVPVSILLSLLPGASVACQLIVIFLQRIVKHWKTAGAYPHPWGKGPRVPGPRPEPARPPAVPQSAENLGRAFPLPGRDVWMRNRIQQD